MSHWRKFKQDVLKKVNENYLVAALKEMGLGLDYSVKEVSNAYGKAPVTAGLTRNGKSVPIGFVFSNNPDGTKELLLRGDFWSTGIQESTFMDDLAQLYQKNKFTDIIQDQGWSLDDMATNLERNKNGEITLEFTKIL